MGIMLREASAPEGLNMRIDRDTRIAGYIASTTDGYVAAGRTVNEARKRAGVDCAGVDIDFATVAELDDLISLPPEALGIEPGAAPWWQEHAPEPVPGLWVLPDGSFYRTATAPDTWGRRDPMRVNAYGPPAPGRQRPGRLPHLGLGYIVGYLRRERIFRALDRTVVAHFEISGESREAVASDDVALPIVERADSDRADPGYLPEYPRCPDCGSRLAWTDVARLGEVASAAPGARRCEGTSCSSAFIDTRFRVALAVSEAGSGGE